MTTDFMPLIKILFVLFLILYGCIGILKYEINSAVERIKKLEQQNGG